MQFIGQRRSVAGEWRYWAAPADGGAGVLSRSLSSGWLAWPSAHLTHPQVSQHLVDLPGELALQVRACVLVYHRGHVD